MTQLQQQLKQVFATLPEAIKDLILSEDFNDRIEVITKKHGLDDDQSATLIRITVRLLSGIIKPTDFIAAMIENAEITREVAVLIAQDINRDIFNGVKDALTELHAGKARPSSVAPQAAPVGLTPAPVAKVVPPPVNSPILAALATPPPPTAGSIFEQKLGGAFRMAATPPPNKMPDPMLIVPPPPQGTNPALRMTPPPIATTPTLPKVDPYRENA